MKRLLWAALAPLTISLVFAAGDDLVKTQGGLVAGAAGKDASVRVYKGIPYAAPPVGDLRWKKPQAPAGWQGTKHATEFSKACMQAAYPPSSIYYRPPEPMGEDCLYLNIWTAAQSAKERRPVMVWIHGGGYTRGSGSVATYDGENLAKKGAVVVTINYRLGIFGFMAHPELTKESDVRSSGNYGLLDMVAALEWVQKNIAAFGGDPKRVTIFGESAGSSAVNFLMASPLAKGLFHRVIGESGANFGRGVALAQQEQIGGKLGTLAELRAKPAEDLMKIEGAFRPCVDGWFLPDSVGAIFAQHKQSDVPLIAGYNADEARSLAPWPPSANAKTFLDQAHKRYGDLADEFLKLYPAGSDEQAAESHYLSSTQGGMGWEMRTWVRAQTKSGKAPAFLYYFTRTPPWEQSNRYRAYHAAEIQYVFANLRPNRPWEEADRKLADAMSSYWVHFAATGNPNGKGLAKWPSYEAKADALMDFGDQVEVKHDVNKTALDFFDRFFASEAAGPRTGSN
jgi:para-nitrobenzyl esterase